MTTRICITSQKGGVGKTTVSLNLAVALAERNRRTLLVDLDPQGGIGLSLARGDTAFGGLAELLMGEIEPKQAVTPTKLDTLSMLTRGRLDPVDYCEYEQALFQPGTLAEALAGVEEGFDYVIVDTPAGVGMVTRAALRASHFALLVFQAESLTLRSVSQALRVIEHVQSNENPALQLAGILPTMVEKHKDNSLAVLGDLWSGFSGVLDTAIPRAEIFAEASRKGLPVAFLGGRPSPEARRFDMLAAEVENTVLRLTKTKEPESNEERQLL